MKVAIFLSGRITNGLDSPTPGEGRYGQNLAKMLAMFGHEVDCIANTYSDAPVWGSGTRYPGVTLSPFPNRDKEYDIVLYIPWEHQYNAGHAWEPCLTVPLKSKFYVHCTFSWGDSIGTDHTCYENNHVLGFPYVQDTGNFPKDKKVNPYPTFPLPMPIYQYFGDVNLDTRKNILWSTKDVFHPEWKDKDHHVPRIGLATLNAIKRLRNKYTFDTHFLSTRYFNPESSWIAKELDVPKTVLSIPDIHIHELLPRDTLLELMSSVRITTIVSGLLGSFGESIAMGAVPLCYRGHLYGNAADKFDLKLDTFHATEDEIYSCLERLYGDDDFYLRVLNEYRNEMRYYSYENAYKYFTQMTKELGL